MCSEFDSKLLTMGPNAIPVDLPGIVSQRFVTSDLNVTCDSIQRFLERLLSIRVAGYARGTHFVNKCTRSIGAHNDFVGMQTQIIRAVLKDVAGSQEDEGENDCDHHVVMQAAARMRPENVALDGLTEIQESSLNCV